MVRAWLSLLYGKTGIEKETTIKTTKNISIKNAHFNFIIFPSFPGYILKIFIE
jgi:hypothetical protein